MEGWTTVIIAGVMALIEITPVKINPISWLGKKLNKSTLDKLDSLERTVDMNDIDTVRQRILSYELLLRKGEHFTQYQYNCLFKDIDKWNKYHEKYPELNGIIKVAIENVYEHYKNEKFDNESK